jgi:tetratricopeptide (TPR) repeat protein
VARTFGVGLADLGVGVMVDWPQFDDVFDDAAGPLDNVLGATGLVGMSRAAQAQAQSTAPPAKECSMLLASRVAGSTLRTRISRYLSPDAMTGRSAISPRELLDHMSVPGYPGWYLIGALERRVTVYSQQVRALNLIYSLLEEKQLGPGDDVVVIGGGVAGLTAAAGAARMGCHVTVLEKEDEVLHLFSRCDKRWLHPRIYDWPQPGSLRDDTDELEVLTWRAGVAGEVVAHLAAQWEELRIAHDIEVIPSVTVNPPRPETQGKQPLVSWRPGAELRRFRVVILAVGFGIERVFPGLPQHSYWNDNGIEGSDHGASKRYLISGLGDGGLIDLVRACIGNFRHDQIVSSFGLDNETNPAVMALGRQLLTIEDEAVRHGREYGPEIAAEYLWKAYTRDIDSLAGFVDAALATRMRRRRKVFLNGPSQFPITLQASILNRLLVARLLHRKHADYLPGTVEDVTPSAGSDWQVTLDNGLCEHFSDVIIRHGTDPALAASFPHIHEVCRKELKPRNALDQTRTRAWPLGYFSPTPPPLPDTGVLNLRSTPVALYSPSNPTFSVPYPAKAEHLVGRAGLLEKVRQQFLNGRPTSIGRTVSFQGIGGLGKTQSAVDYAYHYRHEYSSGVLWLEADRDVDTQLIQIADAAGWIAPRSEHKDKLAVARQRLRTFAGGLVVLDNLWRLADIKEYLPAPNIDVHILVTTRTEQPGFTPVPLDLLSEDDAMRMLVQEAGREPDSEAEWSAARAIARRLDGLPLAIELAGAFLRHRSALTWHEYLATLEADVPSALPGGEFRHVSTTEHEADLRSTLHVSEQVLASALRLEGVLDLLTWSASATMSTSLMTALLDVDVAALRVDLALGAALRLLVEETEHSELAKGRRWRIHRLVCDMRRSERGLDAAWGRIICQRLGTWFEARREDFSDLSAFETEIDHLAAWRTHAESASPSWPECVRLTWLQAYPADHHGNYAEAKALVERALSLYTSLGNADPVLEAHLQNDLGGCYYNLGVFQEALAGRQRGLAIRRAILGDEHPDTARSFLNVGTACLALGDHERALAYTQQALAIQCKVLESKHGDIATSYNTLGTIYAERGDRQTSLSYLEQALAICRQIHGPEHPRTLGTLGNISAVYNDLGKHMQALKYQEQVLAVQYRILGAEHPDYALSLGRIADSHRELGDYTQALEHRQKALKIQLRILRPEHPQIAQSLSHIGTIYHGLRKHAKALKYKKKALAIRQKTLGPEHPDTAASLGALGTAHNYLGEHEQALECYQNALVIERKVFGPQYVRSATNLSNIGSTYQAMGRPEQALRYFRDALAILRNHLGVHHPDTISALVTAARCVTQIGRTRRDIHEQIFEWSRETLSALSKDHSQYAELVRLCRAITPSGHRPTRGGRKASGRSGRQHKKRR